LRSSRLRTGTHFVAVARVFAQQFVRELLFVRLHLIPDPAALFDGAAAAHKHTRAVQRAQTLSAVDCVAARIGLGGAKRLTST
jgi:hypothetical protein